MARRKTPEREVVAAITKALKAAREISPTAFVKEERIYRKRQRFDPTPHQMDLLRYFEKQGFVPRELTLGMHWGMLGGLMTRGRVVPIVKDGRVGYVVQEGKSW